MLKPLDQFSDQDVAAYVHLSAIIRDQKHFQIAVRSELLRKAARRLQERGAGIQSIITVSDMDHLTLNRRGRRRAG